MFSRNLATERRNLDECDLSESVETVLVPLDDIIDYQSVIKVKVLTIDKIIFFVACCPVKLLSI